MSWKDSLLDCSFRGVVVDVIDIEDAIGKAVVTSIFPYQDGGVLEDQGNKPDQFSINAVFFGDDYKVRLTAFRDALKKRGPGELIHPIWGSIPHALPGDAKIRHSAPEPDSAMVQVVFTQSTTEQPFYDGRTASQKADAISQHGDKAVAASGASVVDAVDSVRKSNPLSTLTALRKSMTGPVLQGISNVQGLVTSGLDVLNSPRAWVSDIGSIADGVLGLANVSDLLGFGWSSLTSSLSMFDKPVSGGAPVTASAPPTEMQAVDVVNTHLVVTGATTKADAAAQLFAAEAQAPTMSPPEIESVANDARVSLNTAIVTVRSVYPVEKSREITEPLKDQALAVQEAAKAVIEARPPLMEKPVEAPGNFRLLAHRWYGDHNRATELARLNPALRMPNALQTGDTLNAYAI